MIVINFKTYEAATGQQAVALAATCNEVAIEHQVPIIICPQVADIHHISQTVTIPLFAQHIDPIEPGKHTGKILIDDVIANGAKGTLINHSEHQISIKDIQKLIAICKKKKIIHIVCADSVETATQIAALNPEFIAYEPPELIGGTTSVTTKPKVITELVAAVKKINPDIKILVGAGVHKREDVSAAISLGAQGVLLASGITTAKDSKKVLEELAQGLLDSKR